MVVFVRKDLERMVTISSNITAAYQPSKRKSSTLSKLRLKNSRKQKVCALVFAGEDAEMNDAISFLGRSLVISCISYSHYPDDSVQFAG
jgi:hypothetical protein